MAPPPGTLRVGRYFTALLLLFIVLYGVVFFPGQRHAPKLGIDLVGGIRVVFTALSPKGSPPPTTSQMTQARQILENRINTTGVTGATVVVQGSDQLVVEIPSGTGADVAKLGKAAVLNFRPLVAPAQVVACVPAGATATPSGSASASPSASASGSASSGASAQPSTPAASSTGAAGNAAAERLLAKATPSAAAKTPAKATTSAKASTTPATASTSPSAPSTAIPTTAPARAKCSADPFAALLKADPKLKIPNAENCTKPAPAKCVAFSALTSAQQQEIAAALQNYECTAAQSEADLPLEHYVACDTQGQVAYLLGAVVVRGRDIDSASAQAPNVSGTGGSAEWTVALTLGSAGADSWNAWTSKYNTPSANVSSVQTSATAPCGPAASIPCSDFVGFTLDGQVISAPVTTAALSRQTTISGSFTQTTANELAQELNYGKLPLSFRADQNENVSATLGSVQLKAALLAGGIGLILVVIYSLAYYRGLGLVTIASLLVSAGLTYAMLVILGTQIGFTLDLSGIAGFIVALGITADSFVVFFERIKDEVHEGRSVRVAVPRAWVRARRTILSADTVSFLAAAILYYFASADVKGFAFTLGMSTILDLVVVFLFTHPIVSVLSRSRAFGSARFTGLDSVRVGGIAPDTERPTGKRAPGKPARAGKPVSTTKPKAAPVAVIDREDEPDDESIDDSFDNDDELDPADDEPTRERRHTTPDPGTAAERAAARRARLRGKTDEEGSS